MPWALNWESNKAAQAAGPKVGSPRQPEVSPVGSLTMNGVLRRDLASYTFTQGQGFTATFSPPFDYPANLPRP